MQKLIVFRWKVKANIKTNLCSCQTLSKYILYSSRPKINMSNEMSFKHFYVYTPNMEHLKLFTINHEVYFKNLWTDKLFIIIINIHKKLILRTGGIQKGCNSTRYYST